MKKLITLSIAVLAACSGGDPVAEEGTILMDPAEITMNDYVHDELPDDLLDRIKATTDVFEPIDGISYEQAVDLYRRDFDPESNLRIWEEMTRVYSSFCATRCDSMEKKQEAYKALLLASMLPKDAVASQLQPSALSEDDVDQIVSMYGLAPEPIPIIQK
jgi:hypothetical protein